MRYTPGEVYAPADFYGLLPLARSGCPEALGALFEPYSDVLAKIAHALLDRHLRTKMENLDLVQEVFLEAKKGLGKFKGESPGEWEAWLKKILSHQAKDANKRYRQTGKRNLGRELRLSENIVALLETRDENKAATHRDEEAQLLRTILRKLSQDDRRLIVLHRLKGWPVTKIAAVTHRSNESVRKKFARAMDQARHEARLFTEEQRKNNDVNSIRN